MVRNSTIAVICGALLFASACGQARIVRQTQAGGEIALEGDRQKAMEQAHSAMQAHCQGPYTITEQGEVVIGTDTARADEAYVEEDGTVVSEGGESTRQATEWRVKYVCGNSAPPADAPGPDNPPPPPPPGDGY